MQKLNSLTGLKILSIMCRSEGREMILLGDFNKNLLNNHKDIEWENFVTSLGLSQLVCDPTRVTDTSSTLIDHIYTNFDENVAHVNVCKMSISDHYAVFGNRKLKNCVKSNAHQTFTYRSFKNFDESRFINDLHAVPWETIEYFSDINEIVEVWNKMFLEILNKHAPLNRIVSKASINQIGLPHKFLTA